MNGSRYTARNDQRTCAQKQGHEEQKKRPKKSKPQTAREALQNPLPNNRLADVQNTRWRGAVSFSGRHFTDQSSPLPPRRPCKPRSKAKRRALITMAQAEAAMDAYDHAAALGFALNVTICLSFGFARSNEDLLQRFSRIWDAIKSWFYRHAPAVPFCWILVWERRESYAPHVHILFHVPRGLEEMLRYRLHALMRSGTSEYEERAVHVGRNYDIGSLAYVLKGSEDEVRDMYIALKHFASEQGVVHWRRIKVCHALGEKARNDHI